jgi:hypothetical protein
MSGKPRKKNDRIEVRLPIEQKERFKVFAGEEGVSEWLRRIGEREIRNVHRRKRWAQKTNARELLIRQAYPQTHRCPSRGHWCTVCGKIAE